MAKERVLVMEDDQLEEEALDTMPLANIPVSEEEALALSSSDDGEEVFRAVIPLPAYDVISESRVVRDIAQEIPGFELPEPDTIKRSLCTIDALQNYAASVLRDIQETDKEDKYRTIKQKAAMFVRKWSLGRTIALAIANNDLGPSPMPKLAASLGVATSALYQYKRVGITMSLKEVFTLGLYDADWTQVRDLSVIAPDVRINLVKAYCNSITDWNDVHARAKSKKLLSVSIEQYRRELGCGDDFDAQATSDPVNLIASGTDNQAPEYTQARLLVKKLQTMFKRAADERFWIENSHTLDDYFLMDNVPGAEELKTELDADIERLLATITKLEENIPALKEGLERAKSCGLIQHEE